MALQSISAAATRKRAAAGSVLPLFCFSSSIKEQGFHFIKKFKSWNNFGLKKQCKTTSRSVCTKKVDRSLATVVYVVGFLTQRSELSDLVEVFVLSLAAAAAAALHGE